MHHTRIPVYPHDEMLIDKAEASLLLGSGSGPRRLMGHIHRDTIQPLLLIDRWILWSESRHHQVVKHSPRDMFHVM